MADCRVGGAGLLTPDPAQGESLSGWLGRSARFYFGSAAQFLKYCDLKIPCDGDWPNKQFVFALADVTQRPVWQLQSMLVNSPVVRDTAIDRRLGLSHMPARLGPFLLYDGGRRFCPLCLRQPEAIWPRSWRIGVPVCLAHNVWLENTCATCGAQIRLAGVAPPLQCHRCLSPYVAQTEAKAPLSPLILEISKRIASLENNSRRRTRRPTLDWLALGRVAKNVGAPTFCSGAIHPAQREAFSEFLTLAESKGLCLDRIETPIVENKPEPPGCKEPVDTCHTEIKIPEAQQALQDSRIRVRAALARARRELIAEKQPLVSKSLRKRADAILRKQRGRREG